MDLNRSFLLRREDRAPEWRVIDARGKVLGRLATEIADALRGKDKPSYTPHADAGDYIVVINSNDVVLTGNKWDDKVYRHYTGWRSGLKERYAGDIQKKDPEFIIRQAVKGMLPKNRLSRQLIKKLRVYGGGEHPHAAQTA